MRFKIGRPSQDPNEVSSISQAGPFPQRHRKLVLLVVLVCCPLFLGSSLAEAVVTSYCEETYIGDCLNTRRCNYYENSHWIGSVFVNYHCEGGPGGPI